LRRAARGHRGQGRRRADGDRHRDARRPYQYRGPGAPGLHRSGDLPPLTRTYRTRRRARLDLEGVGTTEGDGTTETEARGQGRNGIKGVAVGRTGVTVTVGAAGVTVGVTVAVTVGEGSGDGVGAGSTGSRKPLSGGVGGGGATNVEAGTPARAARMYADHIPAGRLPPVT